MRRLLVIGCVLAGAMAGGAQPAFGCDCGSTVGPVSGGSGASAPGGGARYVALAGSPTTLVALDRTGAATHWSTLRGLWGTPQVTFQGATGGVSGDGRTVVLQQISATYPARVTRFAVLHTRSFRVRRMVTLHGDFSFDAISPDGRTLYLIQHPRPGAVSYKVRAYDVGHGRLLQKAITDPTRWGPVMHGVAMARVVPADGTRAYTLYDEGRGRTFIHALDTVHGTALCIDLPRVLSGTTPGLALSPDGSVLTVTEAGRPFRTIDTRTYVMAPVVRQPTVSKSGAASAPSPSGTPWGVVAGVLAAALGAAVAVAAVRRGTLPLWRPRSD
jgi:hypothetical protein